MALGDGTVVGIQLNLSRVSSSEMHSDKGIELKCKHQAGAARFKSKGIRSNGDAAAREMDHRSKRGEQCGKGEGKEVSHMHLEAERE